MAHRRPAAASQTGRRPRRRLTQFGRQSVDIGPANRVERGAKESKPGDELIDDATPPPLSNRRELIEALHFASVLEHMLACEYLFAAFSVKKTLADYPESVRSDPVATRRARADIDVIRPWLAQTYTVARQEMEHLGIVQNLLAALGEEPYLMRPAFPVSAQHTHLHAPFRLDRFGQKALRTFIWYERPDYLTEELIRRHGEPDQSHHGDVAPDIRAPFLSQYDSVTKLYTAIRNAFTSLPSTEIFTGDPARQLGAGTFGYRVFMMPVSNAATASAAIDLIMEQGEGIGEVPQSGEPAHFERFLWILRGLDEARAEDPGFEPALPVVPNPWTREQGIGLATVAKAHVTPVENEHARAAMRLFNESYSLMLAMMKSFFATYSGIAQPQPYPQTAMFYAAFFPLMTMVLRPLGEIIARMPADGQDREPHEGRPHAGAGFELVDGVLEGPPRRLMIELDPGYYSQALTDQAAQAEALVDRVPEGQRKAMHYLYENLTATALHLESIWEHGR